MAHTKGPGVSGEPIREALGAVRCGCHRCNGERWAVNGEPEFAALVSATITCGECGHKACPHASDHRLACTGSNEPGQPGSVY